MQLRMTLPQNYALIMTRRKSLAPPHPIIAKSAKCFDSRPLQKADLPIIQLVSFWLLQILSAFEGITIATHLTGFIAYTMTAIIIQDAAVGAIKSFLVYQLQGAIA